MEQTDIQTLKMELEKNERELEHVEASISHNFISNDPYALPYYKERKSLLEEKLRTIKAKLTAIEKID